MLDYKGDIGRKMNLVCVPCADYNRKHRLGVSTSPSSYWEFDLVTVPETAAQPADYYALAWPGKF